MRTVSGVFEMPGAFRILACVASRSYLAKLPPRLDATGLHRSLALSVIRVSLVAHGKPAPDLFIYAAGWMRVAVGDCVVVRTACTVCGRRAA